MKRLLISCTEEEEQEFFALARKYKTSASLLGQYAIKQLLAASRSGVRPMLKPASKNTPVYEPHEYFDPHEYLNPVDPE